MSKLTWSKVKSNLTNLSKKDIVKHVGEIYKKFPQTQEYFQSIMTVEGEEELLEKYKKIIKEEFFPSRGWPRDFFSLSKAKKAISQFKKLAEKPQNVADIMLYYTEIGVEFTNEYGDIDENFYLSMETIADNAAKLIQKHGMEKIFSDRFEKIVRDTSGIGWGFHDELGEIYEEYFRDSQTAVNAEIL
ncbi:MAG: hypothetical protein HQ536_02510 [Parcubacteria group bacterium]|nr:hypothetical protein [Parcubacteria group bacterium]